MWSAGLGGPVSSRPAASSRAAFVASLEPALHAFALVSRPEVRSNSS